MANMLFDALFAPLDGREAVLLVLADGRRISGDGFLRMVARQAQALRGLGLGKGDRIVVQVGKSPEALALYGAAVALGAIFVPLNTAYTADEVAYFLTNAAPRLFVCDGAKAGVMALWQQRRGRAGLLNADDRLRLSDLGAGRRIGEPVACGRISGAFSIPRTTRSKGAMLSHRPFVQCRRFFFFFCAFFFLVREWRFTGGDVRCMRCRSFTPMGFSWRRTWRFCRGRR